MALLAAALTLAGVAVSVHAEAIARQPTIPEPTWFRGWDVELPSSSSRKLMQPGLFTPGHTGSTSCNIAIVGFGSAKSQLNKVKSAKVTCTTTDAYWIKHNGGRVLVYAGKPLYNLYKSQPANWKGIQLALPNEPDFLGTGNSDAVLFFVQAGKVTFKGSVKSMNIVDWAVTHIENGTEATFENFLWQDNYGQRFPSLAAARSMVYVKSGRFINNICTVPRCHTPGFYISEGGRTIVTNTLFQNGRGHLAGAMMVTAGAIAKVDKCTFKQNQVTVNGAFGGAIFHDSCTTDTRVGKDRTAITGSTFIDNKSAGFGGAIRLGSTNGGCPKTQIKGNTFQGNHATYTGGAIDNAYCAGTQSWFTSNHFKSNTATHFNGQIAYNPTTYPKGQPGAGGRTPSGTGCPKPVITASTFSGAPTFSPPWYFP